MIFTVPNSYGTDLREFNKCHEPGGKSEGGQFCSTGGSTGGRVADALPKVRVTDASRTGILNHPDANYHAGRIEVSDKFHKHPPEVREHIMLHELGHWFRDQFVSLSDIMGWEEGDKFYNLFAAGNSEEGFAEAFAVYASNPQELKARYPTQFAVMASLVSPEDVDHARRFARQHSR